MRLYPYLPHPFAITPPHQRPEKTWKLGLSLVGKAIQYFPHFVLAVEAVGRSGLGPRRGRFKILQITNHFTGQRLYEDGKLLPPSLEANWTAQKTSSIRLNLLTPLSLRYQGAFVSPEQFSFHVLIRNLLRRVSALSFFHAGEELDLPFKELIEKAETVQTEEKRLETFSIRRYSARKKQEMPLKGILGEVRFRGPELEAFTPLLHLGELIHVGKNTSFGFGGYEIS